MPGFYPGIFCSSLFLLRLWEKLARTKSAPAPISLLSI
jgi:hypothetical protein